MKSILSFLAAALLLGNATSAQSLSTGLVAYYPFNGNFNDNSIYTNNATQHGGVTFATDKWGNANSCASFDGVDDWVDAPSTIYNTLEKKMTISFLYKPDTSVGSQNLIAKSNYTYPPSINFQYHIGFAQNPPQPTNTMLFATHHYNNCSNTVFLAQDYLYADSVLNFSHWYCITIVFDNGVKKYYVDGVLEKTHIVTSGNSSAIDSCVGGTLRFGTWWFGDPMFYKGLMDEVRIYNRAFYDEEVPSLCNQPITGIHETLSNPFDRKITPNPAHNNILITSSTVAPTSQLTIYNQVGQVVHEGKIVSTSTSVDISNLSNGLYFIVIRNEKEFFKTKFVKE